MAYAGMAIAGTARLEMRRNIPHADRNAMGEEGLSTIV